MKKHLIVFIFSIIYTITDIYLKYTFLTIYYEYYILINMGSFFKKLIR